jgi:hypothetical protein
LNIFRIPLHLQQDIFNFSHAHIVSLLILLSRIYLDGKKCWYHLGRHNVGDELQAKRLSRIKGLFVTGLSYFLVYRALALATSGQLHPLVRMIIFAALKFHHHIHSFVSLSTIRFSIN